MTPHPDNSLSQQHHLRVAIIQDNSNPDQALLSEQLSLLHILKYSQVSQLRDKILPELKLLDTIALLMCTGLPGEHFAVAFDKRQGMEVVLAKSGAVITPEDIADADELFSSLCNPEITYAEDLFPFVARRCRANIVKKIRKLRACILDTGFRDDFYSRLDEIGTGKTVPLSSMKLQFPRDTNSIAEKYTGEPLSVILRELFDGTVRATAVSDAPDLTEFMNLYDFILPLADCGVLRMWPVWDRPVLEKARRFQRRARKLVRYISDVRVLIKDAKRLGGPIKHRWVTGNSLGIQLREEDICLDASTPLEAARHARLLPSEELSVLEKHFPVVVEPWQRSVHTCLHAELRIILHFGKGGGISDYFRPIGVSKPSCLCCALWMKEYEYARHICWMTRSRGRGDPTWAVSARACPDVQDLDLKALDKQVASNVLRLMWKHLWSSSMSEYVDEGYNVIKLV